MPVYSYRCEECGFQFDRHQKFTDPPLSRCPECGKRSLRKVYTPVGIVFKGSGFYSTDHRSPSGMSKPGGSKNSEKASESDSKPAEHASSESASSGKGEGSTSGSSKD
jgi:putative FmdB family regulatory protein